MSTPGPEDAPRSPMRAVLFVDFDNVYLGLRGIDPTAAETFAREPGVWVRWLERGEDSPLTTPRRFLVKNVYLNPTTFGNQRAMFVRSGFRVIDCPSLTAAGKSSADIHMVLDMMDAVQRETRYEDFVLVSADADFTPLLHRIRALDRRTTVVAGSAAAPAYRAVADVFVTAERLVAASTPPRAGAGTADGDDAAPAAPASDASEPVTPIVEAMIRAVRASPSPVPAASVGHAARAVEPRLKEMSWLGAGSLRAFVHEHAAPLEWIPTHQGAFVIDPEVHDVRDVPHRIEGMSSFLSQMCFITGVPALSTEGYRSMFSALAAELAERPFPAEGRTAANVRDRTAALGAPVSRASVSFVLQGLGYARVNLNAGLTQADLAREWCDNVLRLIQNARVALTAEQQEEVRAWLLPAGHEPGAQIAAV